MRRFLDRREAGKQLASKLQNYADRPGVVVLALPRGGVPVAYEVATAIHASLDLLIVRKLGLPGQEELAVGAIASGGIRILNQDIVEALGVSLKTIDFLVERELTELQRREYQYRGNRQYLELQDQTVILVDDGLATGASMLAAVRAVRIRCPARVLVAIPTVSIQAIGSLREEVDESIYLMSPEPFDGVGKWYENFSQTTDEEVQLLLEEANRLYRKK